MAQTFSTPPYGQVSKISDLNPFAVCLKELSNLKTLHLWLPFVIIIEYFWWLPAGKEADDHRLLMGADETNTVEMNTPGCYNTISVELDIANLPINTLLEVSTIVSTISYDYKHSSQVIPNIESDSLAVNARNL